MDSCSLSAVAVVVVVVVLLFFLTPRLVGKLFFFFLLRLIIEKKSHLSAFHKTFPMVLLFVAACHAGVTADRL